MKFLKTWGGKKLLKRLTVSAKVINLHKRGGLGAAPSSTWQPGLSPLCDISGDISGDTSLLHCSPHTRAPLSPVGAARSPWVGAWMPQAIAPPFCAGRRTRHCTSACVVPLVLGFPNLLGIKNIGEAICSFSNRDGNRLYVWVRNWYGIVGKDTTDSPPQCM